MDLKLIEGRWKDQAESFVGPFDTCNDNIGSKKRDYRDVFSDEEIKFLTSEADECGWYVWTEETRGIIDTLCSRRLMARNGDFKVTGFNKRDANLIGHADRTYGITLQYYELIGEGRLAFQTLVRKG